MTDPNPLLAPWPGPHALPPFAQIRPAHFAPAFHRALAEHEAEIRAIAADPAPPSFANTVEALERSGRALRRVNGVFHNLVASLGGPELEALDREFSPRLARHATAIALHPELFRRVAALHTARSALGLAPDQLRLLERLHQALLRAGAGLEAPAKARMAEIVERLAVLHTAFSQNALQAERSWALPLPPADLAGLPESLVAALAEAAQARGMAGHAVILSRSLVEPFLAFSPRRDLRRQVYAAWAARGSHPGPHDNRPLIPEILALRRERARLLGHADFAGWRLADSMAGSAAAAQALLTQVWTPAKARAAEEAARLQAAARAEGMNEPLAAWDWMYYAERVRAADYAVDEAALKPYFELEAVLQAAFEVAGRLFGLGFARLAAPAYHPDVQVYEVREAGAPLGLLLVDAYARPDKRAGAWMSSFRDQEALDAPVRPIVVINGNFARAAPTLLSFDDAETLFHEFGHALHGLMSKVRYPSQSGTSVLLDFVELPSQIFENWLTRPEVLAKLRHCETGAPLPPAMIEALLAARNFNQGFATVAYAASALLDLALHAEPGPPADPAAFEREFLGRIGMPAEIGPRHRLSHFEHVFGGDGYAAGYYAYLWAEVLDQDGFAAFLEAGDVFDAGTAARLKALFAAGDTADPMALYVAMRGRPPQAAALLRGRGLLPA